MSEATRAILTNKEAIAIDQDPLGKQAVRLAARGDLEVWARPLADGGKAVGLFNRGSEAATVTARWSEPASAARTVCGTCGRTRTGAR